MSPRIPGLHHVTAITGHAQRNLDFYAGLLGLRLVKRTVNFDDPSTYHFYYGDESGSPGTILTFFPIAGAGRGRRGAGQVTATALSVPAESLQYWSDRLTRAGVLVKGPVTRFGDQLLSFEDPDGMVIELLADPAATDRPGWAGGTVPAEHAVRGIHSVTMTVAELEPSARLLTRHMGFTEAGRDGDRYRYAAIPGELGALVDLLLQPGIPQGVVAAGSVHHIAWRTPDDAEQQEWRRLLARAGLHLTTVQDRRYFHSIYFREPGGVLYEIATDSPGFTFDESLPELGTSLCLPPWLEGHRARIEAALPPIQVPTGRETLL